VTGPPARRILITTDSVGGVWTYATGLARALCNLGHAVTLVVIGPPPRLEQVRPLWRIAGLRIELAGHALEWMDPEGRDIEGARKTLLGIADRRKPELVHLNSYREAAFGWPAPVLVAAHSCVWSWWESCRGETPNEARWHAYFAGAKDGLAAADAWVAPTRAFRDRVTELYSPPSQGRVIWNGILPGNGSGKKEPFILAAGRLWDEAKNIAALVKISNGLDWPLRAAGPLASPGTEACADEAASIDWLGALSRSQTMAQMRRAAIFVSCALYEPFGLSILEAASCSCALVLSDISTLRELWEGAAIFVPRRDDDALRRGLQHLCRDESFRLELQRAAKKRAARYRLGDMIGAYCDLYQDLFSGSCKGRSASAPAALAEAAA
jgi:glycosyltransferase involved in cell wall biosynthesis